MRSSWAWLTSPTTLPGMPITRELSGLIRRQCSLWGLGRSGIYDETAADDDDLLGDHRLDELCLAHPFLGSRRPRGAADPAALRAWIGRPIGGRRQRCCGPRVGRSTERRARRGAHALWQAGDLDRPLCACWPCPPCGSERWSPDHRWQPVTSMDFTGRLDAARIRISMDGSGRRLDNAFTALSSKNSPSLTRGAGDEAGALHAGRASDRHIV